MKKEYTKPVIKIVSFRTENIASDAGTSGITNQALQSNFSTLIRSDQ